MARTHSRYVSILQARVPVNFRAAPENPEIGAETCAPSAEIATATRLGAQVRSHAPALPNHAAACGQSHTVTHLGSIQHYPRMTYIWTRPDESTPSPAPMPRIGVGVGPLLQGGIILKRYRLRTYDAPVRCRAGA